MQSSFYNMINEMHHDNIADIDTSEADIKIYKKFFFLFYLKKLIRSVFKTEAVTLMIPEELTGGNDTEAI